MDKVMKKKPISNIYLYFIGLIALSFGVVLAIKSSYGIASAVALPFVVSSKFSIVSLGTFNYIYQGCIFILLILIMRKISTQYILGFATSIIFGYTIDLWSYLLRDISVTEFYLRVPLMVFSVIISSIALMCFINSRLPMLPYDLFTQQVAHKYGINFGLFKTVTDITLIVLSIILSFMFFGEIIGIGVGTICTALAIGVCVNKSKLVFDQHFEVIVNDKSTFAVINNEH